MSSCFRPYRRGKLAERTVGTADCEGKRRGRILKQDYEKISPSRQAGPTQSLISEWQRIIPKTSHTFRRASNSKVKQELSAASQRASDHNNITSFPLQSRSPCSLENEMHVQLLLEAKNDAQAINDSNPNDSIMSGVSPSIKFPGRVRVD